MEVGQTCLPFSCLWGPVRDLCGAVEVYRSTDRWWSFSVYKYHHLVFQRPKNISKHAINMWWKLNVVKFQEAKSSQWKYNQPTEPFRLATRSLNHVYSFHAFWPIPAWPLFLGLHLDIIRQTEFDLAGFATQQSKISQIQFFYTEHIRTIWWVHHGYGKNCYSVRLERAAFMPGYLRGCWMLLRYLYFRSELP